MVKDIQVTASRASMLTAQLQSIGRAPSLEPVVLDPVAVLQMNAEVIERIVGSDIETKWTLNPDAGTIRVDAGQFEQMMLNLAINARDAMPDGGELRISVDVAIVDDASARRAKSGVGRVRRHHDQRHRDGHERGDACSLLRHVLYDEGSVQGNRARTRRRASPRRGEQWIDHLHQ